jgi:hypothetical protein
MEETPEIPGDGERRGGLKNYQHKHIHVKY